MTILVTAAGVARDSKERADFVCEGSNDQEQIEAAIQALPETGGRVNLSAGTFYLDGPVALGDKPVALVGEGPRATRLHFALPSAVDGVQVAGQSHTVRDLGIVNGGNLRYGLVLRGAYNRLDRLYIEAPLQAGVRGEPGNSQNRIDQIHVRDSAAYGFHLYGVTNVTSDCIASRSASLGIGGRAGFRLQETGSAYYNLIVDKHESGCEIERYAEGLSLYAPYVERCNRALCVRSVEENHPRAIGVFGGFFYDLRHPADAAVILQRVTGMNLTNLRIQQVASGTGIEWGENARDVELGTIWQDLTPQPVVTDTHRPRTKRPKLGNHHCEPYGTGGLLSNVEV